MQILEIVQNNEKAEGFNQAIVEEAFVFFGENSQFDIPPEDKKMLKLEQLRKLSEIAYSVSDNAHGQPCAVKLYMDKLYVGCSLGPVRVFDIKTGNQENILIPKKKKVFTSRVTCIDISLTGDRLAVGYTNGKV